MIMVAQILHFYPGVRDWTRLSIPQFFGLLHRIPDMIGLGRAEPSSGDLLEMEYRRIREGA